jgi:ribosomal protein S12 methylthiotransferase accessory factor
VGLVGSKRGLRGYFGVTRLADHTGLDVIGLPVWAAIRPLARSISQCHGKGLSHEQARTSAVMEAAETALAETAERCVVATGAATEVAANGLQTVDLSLMLKCRDPGAASCETLSWVPAKSVVSGRDLLAPLDLVSLDFRVDGTCPSKAFHKSSVGLAAHRTRDEAILHGLLEALEYDAVALALAWPGILAGCPAPELSGASSTDLDGAIAMLETAGQPPVFIDVTSDVGLPVVLCWLDDGRNNASVRRKRPFAGHACRFGLHGAALAALLEAAQSRLTDVSGAREDIEPDSYNWATSATARLPVPERTCARSSVLLPDTPYAAIGAVVARMKDRGLAEPLVVDLSRPGDQIACVSVLCPGLEAGPPHEGYRSGERAKRRIVEFGLGIQ